MRYSFDNQAKSRNKRWCRLYLFLPHITWRGLGITLTFFVVLALGGLVFALDVYPKMFRVEARAELPSSGVFGLQDIITIYFTQSMIPDSVRDNIKMSPQDEVVLTWGDKNKKITIAPRNHWQMETRYLLAISYAQSALFTTLPEQKIEFETISYPRVVAFSPENEERDVLIDIEDPITVTFDKSVEDYDVRFKITPADKFAWQLSEDKKTIEVMPDGKLNNGKKYEVKVFIRHKLDRPVVEEQETIVAWSEESSNLVHSSVFYTRPPPPKDWSQNLEERVVQARQFTQPKIGEGKYIDINLTSQILSIFENGKLLDSFLISTGKAGMETPQGQFQIYNKHPRPWSKSYGLYMPFWMAIASSGKYGLHELPEWPGGYKEGANHLGIPVSHGCVRLGIGSAERVYSWAEIGTPVVVYK